MSQTKILLKFRAFLNSLPRNQTRESEIQSLEEAFLKGHCFGFSVCHGAMDLLGKLEWWEDALKHILNWDEKATSLNVPTHLINENDPKNPDTLKEIFERAMNYITLYHTSHFKLIRKMNQRNLLNPEGYKIPESKQTHSYFELLDARGRIKTIQQCETASGCFTDEELDLLLDENRIANSISIVGNNSHAVRIGYRKPYWILYDPNYEHQTAFSIYRKFSTKKLLLDELHCILGDSVSIKTSLFQPINQPIFPSYPTILATNPLVLVKGTGLQVSARSNPSSLITVLTTIDNSRSGLIFKNQLAKALITKNGNGFTGFHTVAVYCPTALTIIFKFMDNSKAGIKLKKSLANALAEKNKETYTGLHGLAECPAIVFSAFVKLLDESEAGQDLKHSLSTTLFEKNDKDISPLQVMARHAPDSLPILLKIIDNPRIQTELKNALDPTQSKNAIKTFRAMLKSRQATTILLNLWDENSKWYRKIDSERWHKKNPSLAWLIMNTPNGNRLLKKFPQLKQVIYPSLKRQPIKPIEILDSKPARGNKRQKIDSDHYLSVASTANPDSAGLFAKRKITSKDGDLSHETDVVMSVHLRVPGE